MTVLTKEQLGAIVAMCERGEYPPIRWSKELALRGLSAPEQTEVAGLREAGPLKLDTNRQVFFYEQDHYYLSNFSAFKIEFYGRRFATAEHAYHFQRFVRTVDQDAIISSTSAHDAFRYAQDNKLRQIDGWDYIKVGVMRNILIEKSRQHEYVRRKLLQTGDRELVENSWRDSFWGWGPNRDGQNKLGKLWMEVRDELRRLAALQPAAQNEAHEKQQVDSGSTSAGPLNAAGSDARAGECAPPERQVRHDPIPAAPLPAQEPSIDPFAEALENFCQQGPPPRARTPDITVSGA